MVANVDYTNAGAKKCFKLHGIGSFKICMLLFCGYIHPNKSLLWQPSNCTELLLSESASHHIIGIIEDSAESLFTYHRHGESWNSYYDPDYTPSYNVKISDPSRGDSLCLVDIAALTNNMSLDEDDKRTKRTTSLTKQGLEINIITIIIMITKKVQ